MSLSPIHHCPNSVVPRRQLLAPVIHPASSGSQGWGWVLGRSLSGSQLRWGLGAARCSWCSVSSSGPASAGVWHCCCMTLVHPPSTQRAVACWHGGGCSVIHCLMDLQAHSCGGGWGVPIIVRGVRCHHLALLVLEFSIIVV
jgi:hypothetical protein